MRPPPKSSLNRDTVGTASLNLNLPRSTRKLYRTSPVSCLRVLHSFLHAPIGAPIVEHVRMQESLGSIHVIYKVPSGEVDIPQIVRTACQYKKRADPGDDIESPSQGVVI